MYIKRQIEEILLKDAKQFSALALTGPRQSGKSTMLKKVFGKTHKYITFDDPVIRERAATDPKYFFSTIDENVILDEIQYIPQLASYIKMAVDENRKLKGRYILTGSQQFQLIKNLGDSLAGRVAVFELLPFSYNEITGIQKLKNKQKNIYAKDIFIHSCLRTSYPEPNINPAIDINTWTASYFQTYLERDIKSIYDIGNLRDFQRFLQLLASRCSQILNLSALSVDLGIAVNTVKRWISILESSRIIYLLNPYYNNMGKRITKAPKIYFLDCGLVCYLTGIHNKDILMKGPLAGALFENFCIQETVKQLFAQKSSAKIYYTRTQNNLEIDLIIEKNTELFPCEIKLNMTPRLSDASNIERFRNIFGKLNIKTGSIISLTDKSFQFSKDLIVPSFKDYINWL
ncbi:MAG: hypothetical protein A2252_05700 [Elusimicrobia bacterium RIFOXYA2_FULL_39_19]|nr:MAG: hypothetical protein A2252_05700 [Elusimicrobia bacterium RIFOXYA2_FULL_39_19]